MSFPDDVIDEAKQTTTLWRTRLIAPTVGRDDLNAAVLDNMRDGVLTLDPDGKVTTVNPALEDMLLIGADDLIGETLAGSLLHRSDLDGFNDLILEAAYAPQSTVDKTIVVERDGTPRYFAVRTNLLIDPACTGSLGLIAVVNDETARVKAAARQKEFSRLLLQLIVTMTLGSLAMVAMFKHLDIERLAGGTDPMWVRISWTYLLLVACPAIYLAWQSGIPLAKFGITKRNLRTSLYEGMIVSLIGIAGVSALALGLRLADPALAGRPMINWDHLFSWIVVSYAFHSCLQELVARGILQTVIGRVLDDKKGYRSIALASLVFASLHAHFGFPMVFISFFSGLIFGWLYHRHRNLAGALLVHIVGGSMVFAFKLF